jgi:prophage antirepressor-like protein
MTALTTFNYLSDTVRAVEIDGQPWIVAGGTCRALIQQFAEVESEVSVGYGTQNFTAFWDEPKRFYSLGQGLHREKRELPLL